ncbi:MAG: YHS domain-containing protein [Chloroherpetonaceae bacterium]|nr:YHS domain-containing protein [Chloroherpetonaceae bacterium]
MKKIQMISAITIFFMLLAFSACSNSEQKSVSEKIEVKSAKDSLTAKTATFNSLCPISGEPVNDEANKVDYEGKTYGFCCNGCDEKFKSNPVKYAANLSPNGKEFIGKEESMH